MEHLLLKAATTAADQGTFEAVISTATVDRDRDIIEPAAMVASLQKWAQLDKLVPLAWNHTDEVIGHIDPASARVENDEVITKGWVDQSIERGQEAWRLVKSGTLSFSFGFLFDPKKAEKLAGGGYRIKDLDIFEISTIPIAPSNNDTRVLSFKSLQDEISSIQERLIAIGEQQREPTLAVLDAVKAALGVEPEQKADVTDKEPEKARLVDPLRKQAESVALEFASDGLSLRKPPRKVEQPKPELIPLRELKQRMRDEILTHLSGEPQ